MAEVEIKVRDRARALRLKRHIEKTHPSTRGMVKVESAKKKRGVGLAKGTNKFVSKMLNNSPDFFKEAQKVTQV